MQFRTLNRSLTKKSIQIIMHHCIMKLAKEKTKELSK